MNARMAVLLATSVVLAAGGCGLSEVSEQACSRGTDIAVIGRTYIDGASPELIISIAERWHPEFERLAAKADDEDVKAALSELSRTYADFAPDMSRRPTALERDPAFERYVDDFTAAVKDRTDELLAACR